MGGTVTEGVKVGCGVRVGLGVCVRDGRGEIVGEGVGTVAVGVIGDGVTEGASVGCASETGSRFGGIHASI